MGAWELVGGSAVGSCERVGAVHYGGGARMGGGSTKDGGIMPILLFFPFLGLLY